VKIQDYIDVNKLGRYLLDGIVDVRKHPTLPLEIYCYSRAATFDNLWDDVTCKTRGLIVDSEGSIVARPFEKFFNLNTHDKPETCLDKLPKTPGVFLDKLDGSLGILYQYNGVDGIATKGSFESDHAKFATSWYHKNCPNPQWPEGFTPIFEIICQSVQTHVVLYDIPDQLILLALVNNETGEEADFNTLWHYSRLNGLVCAEIFNFNDGALQASQVDRPNKEGYVVSYPRPGQTPLKVKIKHETFLKLQKIVHAATPKKILEALINKDYDLLQAWEDGLSFELAEYVRGWRDKFAESYACTLVYAKQTLDFLNLNYETRREKAEHIFQVPTYKKYSSVVFAMMDNDAQNRNRDNILKAVWKIVAEDYKDELDKVREE